MAAAPRPASTSPTTNSSTLGRGETLCPRITPTMSSRPSRRAGASAAISVLAVAHSAMPASSPQRMSNGPAIPRPSRAVQAMTPRATATPRATPITAEAVPRTSAEASTVRRSTAVLAPLLAARARVRRCRAALTANAGPTSSAVMMRSITPPRATMTLICSTPLLKSLANAGSSSSAEGGSRSTAAEVTWKPYPLSSRTSGQVTGSSPMTIQPPDPAASAIGSATTRPSPRPDA